MVQADGEYTTICDNFLDGYNGKVYGDKGKLHGGISTYPMSWTMLKVIINNGKVVSVSGELYGTPIADLSKTDGDNNNKALTITDSKTNIKLETTSDILSADTKMEITEITTGDIFDKIKNNLLGIKNFKMFNITLKSNNTNIQPKGNVKISIPIPADFDDSRLVTYRVEEDASKTEYQVKVTNKYASFETDHFSTYILGETEKTSNETQDKTEPNVGEITTEKNETNLPKTGEETNSFIGCLTTIIVVASIWLVSMLLIDREKKKMTKK